MVQGSGEFGIPRRDRHDRAERHAGEMAATVRRLLHDAGGGIRVVRHEDPVACCDMQIAEEVALAEGGDEHLLGIPPVDIAMEDPV